MPIVYKVAAPLHDLVGRRFRSLTLLLDDPLCVTYEIGHTTKACDLKLPLFCFAHYTDAALYRQSTVNAILECQTDNFFRNFPLTERRWVPRHPHLEYIGWTPKDFVSFYLTSVPEGTVFTPQLFVIRRVS